MRKGVLNRRFFVSFDNMNFHCTMRDQRRHNHSHQNNCTAGYICAMECCGEAECDCGSLSADSIDRKAALNLSFCDLDLSVQECEDYFADVSVYMVSTVLSRYFRGSMERQKSSNGSKKYQKPDPPLATMTAKRGQSEIFTM